MCVPKCQEKLAQALDRRSFLKAAGGAAAVASTAFLATPVNAKEELFRPLELRVQIGRASCRERVLRLV